MGKEMPDLVELAINQEVNMSEQEIDSKIRQIKENIKPRERHHFDSFGDESLVYLWQGGGRDGAGSKDELQKIIDLSEADKGCKKNTVHVNSSTIDYYQFSNGLTFVVYENNYPDNRQLAGYFEDGDKTKMMIEESIKSLQKGIKARQDRLDELNNFLIETAK